MIKIYRTISIILISVVFSITILSCVDEIDNGKSDGDAENTSTRDSEASKNTDSGTASAMDSGTSMKSEDGASSRPSDGGNADSAEPSDGGYSWRDVAHLIPPPGTYPSALISDAAANPPEGGISSGLAGVWHAGADASVAGEYCFVFCENKRFFFDDGSCFRESADFLHYLEYEYNGGVVNTYSKGGFLAYTFEVDLQSDHMVITKKDLSGPITVAMNRIAYDSPLCTSDEVALYD